MRTTVNLNKDLVTEAQKMTGIEERTALIHAGLRALIERDARRLARLGGSEPHLSEPHPEEPPRRRSAANDTK